MDLTVYPRSIIEKLPSPLRPPALLVRNLIPLSVRLTHRALRYDYYGDGLATSHYSPFLSDHAWDALYQRMVAQWYERPDDMRWRMWILTRSAQQCAALSGSFVEFGVYRAGCAFMILSTTDLRQDQQFFLFDTFVGIPPTNLTQSEAQHGFAGRLADTSAAYVADYLQTWSAHIAIVEGDIFETLPQTETGPIAFCHMDLNASAPTRRALDYLYARLIPGGMVVFDDYGSTGYPAQRAVLNAFFADKPERLIALPTQQALLVKC